METARHDPIARIERLLDAVPMVHIDVDIEYAGVRAQELENAEDDVVNVAETGSFALFGVVQAAGPVYGDIGRIGGYLRGGSCKSR